MLMKLTPTLNPIKFFLIDLQFLLLSLCVCFRKYIRKIFFSRIDFRSLNTYFQGHLGNCWMAAALSSLAMNEALLDRVVPKGQRIESPKYRGIFQFRLNSFFNFNRYSWSILLDHFGPNLSDNVEISLNFN